MRWGDSLKIGVRLSLILTTVICGIILIFGFIIYGSQKKQLLESSEDQLNNQIDDLTEVIIGQVKMNQNTVNSGIKIADFVFRGYGNLREDSKELISMTAVNQLSQETETVKLPAWYVGNTKIHGSYEIVDRIKDLTGQTVTVFQKINNGYLRISTNVTKVDGSRAVGTFIPNSSPVVEAIEKGEMYQGRAFVVNDWYLTAYEPIKVDNSVKGILYVGVPEKDLGHIREYFSQKKILGSGFPYIVDKKGDLIIHRNKEGKNIINEAYFKEILKGDKEKGCVTSVEEGSSRTLLHYYRYCKPIDSYIVAAVYQDELLKGIHRMQVYMMISLLVIGCLIVMAIWFVVKKITTPLQRGVDFVNKIASGNLNVTLDITQKDEVGLLAEALNCMVVRLKDIVHNVVSTSKTIDNTSRQLYEVSRQITEGANEQAASIEEVSSSIEEMSGNIMQNSDNACQTEKISVESADSIKKSYLAVQEGIQAMKEITDKISIIHDIAFQTNLLALNAAVEAARAGDHGRGFAVVAAEVRKLAERSKIAADQVAEISHKSMETAEKAGKSLSLCVPEVERTASLVKEISAAGIEQNSGVEQINNAIQQLTSVTQNNASDAENMTHHAESLRNKALELNQAVAFFKVDRKEF